MDEYHESMKLDFLLTPDAAGRMYEALVCLQKFSETVLFEAREEKVTMISLNLSKTAYARFTFDAFKFFDSYYFRKPLSEGEKFPRFTAQFSNKALQCAFKNRVADPSKEAAIESCRMGIDWTPDQIESRFMVKMLYKSGMVKLYELAYESTPILRALFDKDNSPQSWKISSRVMREYIEYFGPKTEQLDMIAQDQKAIFTSFTEKISDGKEVLKQPLETSITLHLDEFEDFHVREQTHIVISVKDFRAVIVHAETLHGSVAAYFSKPGKPMMFESLAEGLTANFTLMTSGQETNEDCGYISNRSKTPAYSRQASTQPSFEANPIPQHKHRTLEITQATAPSLRGSFHQEPPPLFRDAEPAPLPSRQESFEQVRVESYPRKVPAIKPEASFMTAPSQQESGLFIPDDEWGVPMFDDEAEEDELELTNYNPYESTPRPTFQDSVYETKVGIPPKAVETEEGIEPTQRLSQLHGMFD